MARFCTKCGSVISSGQRFCAKCGANIGVSPATRELVETQTADVDSSTSPISTTKMWVATGAVAVVLSLVVGYLVARWSGCIRNGTEPLLQVRRLWRTWGWRRRSVVRVVPCRVWLSSGLGGGGGSRRGGGTCVVIAPRIRSAAPTPLRWHAVAWPFGSAMAGTCAAPACAVSRPRQRPVHA